MHCTSEIQAERPKSDSVRPVNDLLKQDNRDRLSTVNTVPLAPFPDHLKMVRGPFFRRLKTGKRKPPGAIPGGFMSEVWKSETPDEAK